MQGVEFMFLVLVFSLSRLSCFSRLVLSLQPHCTGCPSVVSLLYLDTSGTQSFLKICLRAVSQVLYPERSLQQFPGVSHWNNDQAVRSEAL